MTDTIFARASGSPPAAIGIIRISGPHTSDLIRALAGTVPDPRRVSLRNLRAQGELLDQALVLWLPGPNSPTGEDCAELHCHGGRAVLSAVEGALSALPGARAAAAGEFTRRAFMNGRMDLAEAEGLADLLAAETEMQRQMALAAHTGQLSRDVERWTRTVLALSAEVETSLDFADEDDAVEGVSRHWWDRLAALTAELDATLARPPAERLRDGVRVVFAGPPNAGKSSLFNALLGESAAIVTPEAGTTRDAIERAVAIDGVPLVLVDTAGLREEGAGAIEALGIARSQLEIDRADLVIWLGAEHEAPEGSILLANKCDLGGLEIPGSATSVSALTGEGLAKLCDRIAIDARRCLPSPGSTAINQRQRDALTSVLSGLVGAAKSRDLLLVGENLRVARRNLDAITGAAGTEDMLDALFSKFCIGK